MLRNTPFRWKRTAVVAGLGLAGAFTAYIRQTAPRHEPLEVTPPNANQTTHAQIDRHAVQIRHQDNVHSRLERGRLFTGTQDFQLAETDFLQAIELDPQSADSHAALYHLYRKQGLYTQAIVEKTKALAINPSLFPRRPLVVGAGVCGAGIAAGLTKTGNTSFFPEIIDKSFPAAGTSSRPTGMIHGGLRYLEQVLAFSLAFGKTGDTAHLVRAKSNLDLVIKSIHSRNSLMRRQPELVKENSLMIAIASVLDLVRQSAGLGVSEFISTIDQLSTPDRVINLIQRFSKSEMGQLMPALKSEVTRYGAFALHEGEVNATRLTQSMIMGAVDNGADLYTETAYMGHQETANGIDVTFRHTGTGEEMTETYSHVIFAMGPWEKPSLTKRVKGSHLYLDDHLTPSGFIVQSGPNIAFSQSLTAPTGEKYTKISTTEQVETASPDDIQPTDSEKDELTTIVQSVVCRRLPDVMFMDCAERPLAFDPSITDPNKMPRGHRIVQSGRVINVTGVKLSEAEYVGAEVTAQISGYSEKDLISTIESTPFRAVHIANIETHIEHHESDDCATFGVTPDTYRRLINTHGAQAYEFLSLAQKHPELTLPIDKNRSELTAVEVVGLAKFGPSRNPDSIARFYELDKFPKLTPVVDQFDALIQAYTNKK